MGNLSKADKKSVLPGDPNCPICHGIGFIRHDLPIHDPNFGKMEICSCRREQVEALKKDHLYNISNVESFRAMTFETFNIHGRTNEKDANKSLEVAFQTAKNFAARPNGWLFLTGKFGCGKTHLAAAIANEVIQNGTHTLFLTVPDLLDWLRYAFSGEDASFEERFSEIRDVPFLVLDDLGTQNSTPWAEEKLFQIINHRYVNRLHTVITSNLDIAEIDERISSRINDRDLVMKIGIIAPDYRDPFSEHQDSPISTLAYLSDHRTFNNFSARKKEKLPVHEQKSLDQAFLAAQHFAENPNGWLVFLGAYGTGKTHLAASIANYRQAAGDDPIFTVVPDLLDHLRATFNPNSPVSYDSVFNQVRNAKLLILDDLGTQNTTPWAKEKLFQILNFRYETKAPTVITSSIKLEDMDPRIRSRMLDSRVCEIYSLEVRPFESL
ncbi:MAG: ATP-binding protein [Pelolinea sp.]|jgi:DNA replication protein DnaC|nr:ATP-binding protein [Pelolinea sp.]